MCELNFPIQTALSDRTQTEARVFRGNFVEPLAELASTDLSVNVLQFLSQGQFPNREAPPTTDCLPTVSQEEAMLQLAASHQMLQYQQALTESLTEQLTGSQERIAQMERDLALLQQSYDEQWHLLKNSEANCQDLQARLYRQQHQALQFKAALKKSLDAAPQNQPNSNQGYHTPGGSQPSRQSSTGCEPSQRISVPTNPLISDQSLSDSISCGVSISVSSVDTTHQPVVQHVHVASKTKHRVFSEVVAYSQEKVYPLDRPSPPPLSFQGQPVQPWSKSLPTRGVHQEQSTIRRATSTVQVAKVEAPKPNQRNSVAPTGSIQSSPLLEPLQPAAKRKPPTRVELPTLPRRRF